MSGGPIEHTFMCAACGAPAGTILLGEDGVALPRRDGPDMFGDRGWRIDAEVHGGGAARWPLDDATAGAVIEALDRGDLAALAKIDRDLTRFTCPQCQAAYCSEHLVMERVVEPGGAPSYDWYWAGRCAEGHTFTAER